MRVHFAHILSSRPSVLFNVPNNCWKRKFKNCFNVFDSINLLEFIDKKNRRIVHNLCVFSTVSSLSRLVQETSLIINIKFCCITASNTSPVIFRPSIPFPFSKPKLQMGNLFKKEIVKIRSDQSFIGYSSSQTGKHERNELLFSIHSFH